MCYMHRATFTFLLFFTLLSLKILLVNFTVPGGIYASIVLLLLFYFGCTLREWRPSIIGLKIVQVNFYEQQQDFLFHCHKLGLLCSFWFSIGDLIYDGLELELFSGNSFLQKGDQNYYVYGGWWSVWWTGTYSMVLSKAAFFHKKYLSLYTNQMPDSIKEYITKNRFLFYLFVYHLECVLLY